MSQDSLEESIHHRVQDLCAKGDALADQQDYEKAYGFYREALGLIPDPAEDCEATTWVLAAIGDLYFHAGKFDKSIGAFNDAIRCPGGLGNPFIHLRLGESYLELSEFDRAAEELTMAYMGAGREIFDEEEPKYLAFLQTRIKPPVGQSML